MKQTHIHHYHRHMSVSYPVSFKQRFYSLLLVPTILLVGVLIVIKMVGNNHALPSDGTISLDYVLLALITTFVRLAIAYVLALAISIPLALLINKNAKAERILLPLFDIIQSVPVLAFFPVVILFFAHYQLFNGAAIFILLITMLWSIVFSMVGGLRVIPQDIKEAAKIYKVSGLNYVKRVLLPATVPYLITGSLLAWAAGWNIVIVAEVLHTYLPSGYIAPDLYGIGSLLVTASASGDQHLFITAMVCMVIFIALINFFVWQKLLGYAEKFKFE